MARKVTIELVVDAKGAVTGLKQVTGEVNRLDKATDGASKGGAVFKKAFNFLAAGAVLAGLRRLGPALIDITGKIGDLAETQSKFDTVFGASTDTVNEFIAANGRLLGLTNQQAQELLSTTGAILQGAGFVEAASAEASVALATIAGDLASFNNKSPEEVFLKLQAAITGEREGLKQLGIVIQESEVQTLALAQSSKESASALTQQEKVTATLTLITQKMGVAQGDLARTQDSATNQMRKIGAVTRQLADDFFGGLAPALAEVVSKISDATDNDALPALARELGEHLGDAILLAIGYLEDNAEAIEDNIDLFIEIVGEIGTMIVQLSDLGQGFANVIGNETDGHSIISLGFWLVEVRELFEELNFVLGLATTGLEALGLIDTGDPARFGQTITDETDDEAAASIEEQNKRIATFLEERRQRQLQADDDEIDDQKKAIAERLDVQAELTVEEKKHAAGREKALAILTVNAMAEGLERELAEIDRRFSEREKLLTKKFPEEAGRIRDLLAAQKELVRDEAFGLTDELVLAEADVLIADDLLTAGLQENTRLLVQSALERAAVIKSTSEEQAADIKKLMALRAAEEKLFVASVHSTAQALDFTTGSVRDNVNEVIGLLEREIAVLLTNAIAKQYAFFAFLGPFAPVAAGASAAALIAAFKGAVSAAGLAQGVTGFGGGLALVGEEGPELVSLGRGSNVITNENTQALLGGGGAMVVAELKALRREMRELQVFVNWDDFQRAQQQNALLAQRTGRS